MNHAIQKTFGAAIAMLLLCLVGQAQGTQPHGPGNGIPHPVSRMSQETTPAAKSPNVRATERVIDASVPDDPAVVAVVAPYSAKVRTLDEVIGKLDGDLRKGGIGGGSLGNFVADALRAQAEKRLGKPVLLAVTNSGGLRKNFIAAGDLRVRDIYELLPFENALVTLDLSGEQLLRFLRVIVAARDAQSGARITYRTSREGKGAEDRSGDVKNELANVKLGDGRTERGIDPTAIYTIATIDYLVKRGGDYAVLQEAKNIRPLGITMRDAVLDYVKTETSLGHTIKATLDQRFQQDTSAAVEKEVNQPR